jgi:cardiolipin synthase
MYLLTLMLVILSAATDVIDGIIARRFNLVSDVGKILDPIADKLTQLAVLGCLVMNFWYMLIPVGLLVVKELFAGIVVLVAIKKTGVVNSSVWHGKLTTVLLYGVMGLHLLWPTIPQVLSYILVFACTGVMIMSAILYAILMFGRIKKAKQSNKN